MYRFAVLVAAVLLVGPARAADEAALWRAAFALDKPGKEAEAEATLLKGGAAAYDVLTKLARVSGEERALALAAGPRSCVIFAMHRMRVMPGDSVLPRKVSELALKLLVDSPELRQRAEASEEPFDRAMALLAASGMPGALPGALERLRQEKEPWVLLWSESLMQCVTRRPGAAGKEEALAGELKALSQRTQPLRETRSCVEPSQLEEGWVEALAKGTVKAGGWSSTNETFWVNVSGGPGESLNVGPGCAVALYEAVAKRGRYVPELLVPVATEQRAAVGARGAAGARAAQDLERYPEEQRNALAAKLVNAGFSVPRKVTFKADDTFAQTEVLEAAARQGHPGAKAAILQHVHCQGTFGDSGVGLLGFVKGREAADLAFQLARKCPRARAEATAALLRLKDRRALELLGPALEDPGFGYRHIERALLESLTPQVATKLRALAEKKSHRAEDMLRLLTAAQVLRE
jgi:hypothetical protein